MRATLAAGEELKLQLVNLNHFHSDGRLLRWFRASMYWRKTKPASPAIQQMEGTQEETNFTHTAFKIFQMNLGFLAPTDKLYSMLDEQPSGNSQSVSYFQ